LQGKKGERGKTNNYYKMTQTNRTNLAFILLTVAALIVTFCITIAYIDNTTERLFFSITKFELPEGNRFSIGENSDVCYAGVPEGYMTVGYENNGFSYEINEAEPCLYYFVNNVNPNRHPLRPNSILRIPGLPPLNGDLILGLLKHYKNEYYMLVNVLRDRIQPEMLQEIESGDMEFNSFIHKQGENYSLIILDPYTTIDGVGYCYANALPEGNEFKIQFFQMKSWSTGNQSDGNQRYLSDSIRSYYAKPVQLFTEWGAGHVLVRRTDENRFAVTFPKAITTTIPIEKIRETGEESEMGVYLKQMLKSYPMPTDFYIPAFSDAFSEYVCELTPDRLFFQEQNRRDTTALQLSNGWIPAMDIRTQELELGQITYKAQILDGGFYGSKHVVLFLAYLVLSVVLFVSFPKSRTEKVKNVRWYLLGMFTLFWFFLNQKLLIAEKLAFTYPYFEKIYPTAYLSVLFSLFIVFLLIILVNQSHIDNDELKYVESVRMPSLFRRMGIKEISIHIRFSLIQRVVTVVLIAGTVCFVFVQMYGSFVQPIWGSYPAEDVSGLWKFWNWQTIHALNDNHFSVWVMLGGVLALLLVVFVFSLSKPVKKTGAWCSRIEEGLFGSTARTMVSVFMCIVIAGIVAVLGNVGTAVAALSIVFFLRILMQRQLENSVKKSFGWLSVALLFCCFFVGIGLLSDFGFLIYVFGIVTCWFILMFSSTQYEDQPLKPLFWLLIVGVGVCFLGIQTARFLPDPENIDYNRSVRRIHNYLDADRVKETGYLYSESDMQWMEIMRYYAEKANRGQGSNYDIYGEDNNFHSLVASGQSPVILNDLSVPGVYLGSLRCWAWVGLLFGVTALSVFVFWFSIGDNWRKDPNDFEITPRLIGRLLASQLWLGATLYLLASYYWKVPFTGRLIPGFGVDAVGEALEIIILFAFMCALHDPFAPKQSNKR
jgi:hypothetical protein